MTAVRRRRRSHPTIPLHHDHRPAARGTLGERPLVHIIVYAHQQELTGSLVLSDTRGQQHVVYFRDGEPAAASTCLPSASLADVLRDLTLASTDDIVGATGSPTHQRTGGREVVRRGMFDRAELHAARVERLRRRIRALFDLGPQTRFTFYPRRFLVEANTMANLVPCEPLGLILDGIRQRPEAVPMRQALAKLHHQVLRIRDDAPLAALDARLEAAVFAALRTHPMTLADLLEHPRLNPRVVRTTVYALLISRSLQLNAKAPTTPQASAGRYQKVYDYRVRTILRRRQSPVRSRASVSAESSSGGH